MNNAAVVFDTNAYRDFCATVVASGAWTMASLRAKEQQKQITSYANPFVIMELSSHLWDEHDPDYAECRCGLASLYQHCCTDQGDQLRVLADAESLVAHMLYGRFPPAHAETTERLSKLARAVAGAPAGTLDQRIVDACKELADYLDGREKLFVQDMQGVVKAMNPACTDWNPFAGDKAKRQAALAAVRDKVMPWRIAMAHVLKARGVLGIPINDPDLKGMTDAVLDHAPAAVALYREIMERIVNTGCDVSKKQRANWIWDMQIAVGFGEEVGDPPQRLTLVTGDGAIVDAAKAAGMQAYVHSLDDYLKALT